MRAEHINYLICPHCFGALEIMAASNENRLIIETGELGCRNCHSTYPIVRNIPRFVSNENYTSNFGMEWNKHARTQYDCYTGLNLSSKRFFEETRWPRDLKGQTLLEVGSGSGRFTEPAASTNAFIVSLDYSQAVEANYQSNGHLDNVLIVQADIYSMPFRPRFFDKIFSFGMLQHTPDPYKAFLTLPYMLKEGGELVIDIYKLTLFTLLLHTKYYIRFITKRIDPEKLYTFTCQWVDLLWPMCKLISRIPRIGPALNWRLLVPDHSQTGLQGDLLKEWAYLDSFDMLSPRYDYPQTRSTIQRWFEEAGLRDIEVKYGYNGIEGRGKIKSRAGWLA
jgi:SAM-dependent methyltransferase